MTPPDIQNLACKKLKVRQAVQPREAIDEEVVGAFSELLSEDAAFQLPPIVAYQNERNGELIVSDGFHRLAAYITAERTLIPVEVRPGDEGDASWAALSANSRHGRPLSPSETRGVIKKALDHRNRKGASLDDLAKMLGVSSRTISRVIAESKPAKGEKATREKGEKKDKFSPEVIEAIDAIGLCNENAKMALLNGSIKKPDDELIAFSEYDCPMQERLAPYFFTMDLTLQSAVNMLAKRPSDIDCKVRELVNYAQLKGVAQTWYFFNDSVQVDVTLLVETPEAEIVKPPKPKAPTKALTAAQLEELP